MAFGDYGFGHCSFGHTCGSGGFGNGPFTTFAYTPGYTYSTVQQFNVQVSRFEDTAEQRYLLSKQQGLTLHYEFPFVSSATMLSIASFFQDAGGVYRRFLVTDHRTGLNYLGRFASPVLGQDRGPSMVRHLNVDFIVEGDGGAPVGVPRTVETSAACLADMGGGTNVNEPTAPTLPTSEPGRFVWSSPQVAYVPNSLGYFSIGFWTSDAEPEGRYGSRIALPRNTTFRSLTAAVELFSDFSSVGPMSAQFMVNDVPQSGITLVTCGTGLWVATGTVVASVGDFVWLVTSLSNAGNFAVDAVNWAYTYQVNT